MDRNESERASRLRVMWDERSTREERRKGQETTGGMRGMPLVFRVWRRQESGCLIPQVLLPEVSYKKGTAGGGMEDLLRLNRITQSELAQGFGTSDGRH